MESRDICLGHVTTQRSGKKKHMVGGKAQCLLLTTNRSEAENLRTQLQEAEALIAVDKSADVLHSMSGVDDSGGSRLGPSVYCNHHLLGVRNEYHGGREKGGPIQRAMED